MLKFYTFSKNYISKLFTMKITLTVEASCVPDKVYTTIYIVYIVYRALFLSKL